MTTVSRRQEVVLVVVLLLLGAAARMFEPGLTHFQADEARLYTRALVMAQGGDLATHGIASSIGFPNSPVSVWLYALPLAVWPHVYGATLFTGLANSLALAGCWWVARRYWGPRAAVAALLLFAVAPWAIVHSRRIWAQNLLGPLVVAWGIAALLTFVERRARYLVAHLLALGLAVLAHFAALALAPASLALLIIFRRRVQWRSLALGVLLALLPALPFLVYLAQEGSASLTALTQFGGDRALWRPASWRFVWLLFSGSEIHSLAGPEQFRSYLAAMPPMAPAHLVLGLLLLAGIGLLGRQAWKRRVTPTAQGEAAVVLLIWLLSPPLFFLVFPAPVVLHYLLPIYPIPFVAAGVGCSGVIRLLPRQRQGVLWRGLAWLVLLSVAALQLWGVVHLHRLVADVATPGGFSTPLALQLESAEAAKAIQRRQGGEILIASAGENPDIDGTAAIYDALLAGWPHRFVDVRRSALFPAGPAVVLLAAEAGDTGPAQLYLASAGEHAETPLRQGEGTMQVITINRAPEPDLVLDEPVLFANWVRLYGYDQLNPGDEGQAPWRLYWQPGDNPDPADYHLFNHLLDAEGNRIAQADAAAYAPWQWRAGDTVISVFDLNPPADAARPLSMRTGFYRYPSLESVPVLDVALNPAADAVTLPAE